jgi:hypothetical protein
MGKKIIIPTIILVLLTIVNVSAITGSLGNSRMILYLEPGESVEKYLTIKNVNDFQITVDIDTTGDLANNVEIQDSSFVLDPGVEKKAYFTITAGKKGQTETRLNVRFTPPEGNGVGLTSVIVVNTKGDDSFVEEEVSEEIEEAENGFSFKPSGGITEEIQQSIREDSKIFSIASILIYMTIILAVSFLVLLAYYYKINTGKRVKGSRA